MDEHDKAFYEALIRRLARELLEAEGGDKDAALRLWTWLVHPVAEALREVGEL